MNASHLRWIALTVTVAVLAGCTSVPNHQDAWLSFKYETHGPGCGPYSFPTFPPNASAPAQASSACPGLSDFNEAQNYYNDIGAPATLAQWKSMYGFPATGNPPARALYANYRDLRIGRDMNCVQNGQQVACYVTNYGPAPQDCGESDLLSVNCTWPNLELAVVGAITATQTPPPPAQITGFSTSCSFDEYYATVCTSTFQAMNSFTAGQGVIINGLSVGTNLNGQTFVVSSTGLSNTQFETNSYHVAKYTTTSVPATTDSGTATYFNSNVIATVAMVYNGSPDTTTTSPPNNVTFYVYDQFGNLLPYAALDAEGEKSVPRMCMACHGGSYTPHSATSPATVTGTSFLPFDVPSFYYSTTFPNEGVDRQQEAFRMLNLMVKATNNGSQPQTANQIAIDDFINGMYCPDPNNGGVLGSCSTPVEKANSTASDAYFPAGWAGSSEDRKVYSDVVKPYCRMCHLAQPAVVTFFDSSAFKAFGAQLVCTTNDMPHAEVPFGGDTASVQEIVYPPFTASISINPFISNNDASVFWLNAIAQKDVQTETNITSCQ